MSNCSDTGLQGSSPRDARFMEFVAKGPGIAWFRLDINPETDGDAAAQFLAQADKARAAEMDLAVEAFEDAEEVADLPRRLVVQYDEVGDEDDEEEGTLSGVPAKYLKPRQWGIVEVFHAEASQARISRRQGSPVFNTAAILRDRVEAARLISKAIVAEEKTRKAPAAPAVQPEPPKGNGHRPAVPPIGKFLAGVVVDQGHKGLLVDIGNGFTARVPIADERGHGSWDSAAAWILGFKPGTKVRLRVIRVNGVIEAILADRHPRPFWKKEVEVTTEARPAN